MIDFTPPALAEVLRLCVTKAWNCVVVSLNPTVFTLAILSEITANAVDCAATAATPANSPELMLIFFSVILTRAHLVFSFPSIVLLSCSDWLFAV